MTTGELDTMAADESALAHRLRFLAALLVAAVMFWHVGFLAAGPEDSGAPVTLLLVRHRLLAMTELLGLALAGSGLAVAIAGPGASAAGPLAIAVGLAAMAWRGGAADLLPVCLPAEAGPWPARQLVFELWLWLGLIGVGAIAGRWVETWFSSSEPRWERSRLLRSPDSDAPHEPRRAFGAVLVTAGIGLALTAVLGGSPVAAVQKGQVFFAVGASFYIGSVVALWLFPLQSGLWLLFSVALGGTVAYVFGAPALSEDTVQRGAHLLLPVLARPLPIEFASLGTAGVIVGFVTSRADPGAAAGSDAPHSHSSA